jgi:hypothetical protein
VGDLLDLFFQPTAAVGLRAALTLLNQQADRVIVEQLSEIPSGSGDIRGTSRFHGFSS